MVVGVAAAASDPDAPSFIPFAYSVGLDRRGWPELLTVGMVHVGTEIINFLSERDDPPAPGPVDVGGRFPLWAVRATDPRTRADYVIQTDAPHGVIQLVACDTQGRYPWDDGCLAPYASIPVLGDPTETTA